MRQIGHEVLHRWARRQPQKKEDEYHAQAGVNQKRKKKLYWYTQLRKIEISEPIITQGRRGGQIRPLAKSAEVRGRRGSPALQRAMIDFGADDPFSGAAGKLKEP
jgi:hypothetical protein